MGVDHDTLLKSNRKPEELEEILQALKDISFYEIDWDSDSKKPAPSISIVKSTSWKVFPKNEADRRKWLDDSGISLSSTVLSLRWYSKFVDVSVFCWGWRAFLVYESVREAHRKNIQQIASIFHPQPLPVYYVPEGLYDILYDLKFERPDLSLEDLVKAATQDPYVATELTADLKFAQSSEDLDNHSELNCSCLIDYFEGLN